VSPDNAALVAVTVAAKEVEDARAIFQAEAEAWVEDRLYPAVIVLEQAVIDALDEGHSVVAVATAYTISGRTPNRNAIYNIRKSFKENPNRDGGGDFPFEWVERVVKTRMGERTVYDIHANVQSFGPDEITGEFTWRYDVITQVPEPVISREDPYPHDVRYYRQALSRWLTVNPYPGG